MLNDITKQRCGLVVSERRYAKCSSLYHRIIGDKTNVLRFLGRIIGMDLTGQLRGLNIVPVIWKYKETKRK
jgi:hypothetical protein